MGIEQASRDYGKLRKHQLRALVVAREIAAGRRHQKVVVAGVTPGGGKTLMASVFANELADQGVIDLVLVLVPNEPLREQMRQGFHDLSRGLTRHLSEPDKQKALPGLGEPFGKVVTYQSIVSEKTLRKLLAICSKLRVLLILDECHHLLGDKAWEVGCRKLVEASALTLCMSGTLWRWDNERIPFVSYDESRKALVDIRYSRAEALSEQAVLEGEFKLFDGAANFSYRDVPRQTTLSLAVLKDRSMALKTCLRSESYVHKFLKEAFTDWERYRTQSYPSQLIVACHDQKHARQAYKFIAHHWAAYNPVLSVCSVPTADRAIRQFRNGQASVLVTVKKAYEGLDVKGATHLVYLGDIRSWPFLDQVIARVTRFNPNAPLSWGEQKAYVYTPDDVEMRDYIRRMLEEQAEYYMLKEEAQRGTNAAPKRGSFRPESAEATDIANAFDGYYLTTEENIGIDALAKAMPQLRAPLKDRLKIAYAMVLVPKAPGEAA